MAVDFLLDWPEVVAGLFFCIGMLLALFAGNFWMLYGVAFLMGLLFGRVWYRQQFSKKTSLVFSILLFLLGLFLGSFFAWVRAVTLLLAAGMVIAYWLHKQRIVESVEF